MWLRRSWVDLQCTTIIYDGLGEIVLLKGVISPGKEVQLPLVRIEIAAGKER
ncbi:MAG TPA: hypothetical protein VMI32_01595 [Candidatus Solibacter sp.]|nr:hypothetical protein [Candidatus Solibacter sp.]